MKTGKDSFTHPQQLIAFLYKYPSAPYTHIRQKMKPSITYIHLVNPYAPRVIIRRAPPSGATIPRWWGRVATASQVASITLSYRNLSHTYLLLLKVIAQNERATYVGMLQNHRRNSEYNFCEIGVLFKVVYEDFILPWTSLIFIFLSTIEVVLNPLYLLLTLAFSFVL